MKYLFPLLLFLILPILSTASDIKISSPILYIENGSAYVILNLSWNNSWRNEKNNDAAWLFFKWIDQEGKCFHLSLKPDGHSVISDFSEHLANLNFETSDDLVGLFVFPKEIFRGNISTTLKIMLDPLFFDNINTRGGNISAYGVEMVNIPEGRFNVGDLSKEAIDLGAFYKPDDTGDPSGFIEIKSAGQSINISETGDLFYQAQGGYEGDQKGIIPSTFPNGFSSYYMMKYEISEGQYVSFLNSLSSEQLNNRNISIHERYYSAGGSIKEEESLFFTELPNKPCQFMGWDDVMAYADWAGLRPMTEFEFTKAARGPVTTMGNDFPWGTNTKEQIQRLPNQDGVLVMLNEWDESYLEEETRKYFGASYFWVMDLSGSLWERLVTVGHENGRNFLGTHGDGIITDAGYANIENWPKEGEADGGIGFRGGGFYGYDRSYHLYNPFSPVAYRPYGGWHGGMRTDAYGSRLVRSSN